MLEQIIDSPYHAQVERIRAVFGLREEAPLPLANLRSLHTYRNYLSTHLTFPFQGLCSESKPPIRHLVHYISVVGLVDVVDQPLEGIICRIEGIPPVRELPLVEVGVREDDPSFEAIDDYAYWFLNWR